MQGICHHAPPGGFLPRYTPGPPRLPSQCVIVATSDLLRLNQTESQLWLQGIFVRVARQAPSAARPTLLSILAGSVWATQVTFEGYRQEAHAARIAAGSKAFFQGAICADAAPPTARCLWERYRCGCD